MALNDGQYERIAEWLDLPRGGGGRVELTADERAAAEQIRRAEAELAARLACEAPRAAMDRARRRMLAELARPARRRPDGTRLRYIAAAAAAAAIVLGVMLFRGPGPQGPQTPVALPNLPTDTLVAEALKSGSADLDLLAGEIDAFEVDLLASGWPAAADPAGGLDELEHEIDEFWMEQSPPDMPEG